MKKQQIIPSIAEIFTLSLLCISLFNVALREQSEQLSQLSELFALCGEGISFKALAELLLLSVAIGLVKYVWFSDRFCKNLLLSLRITLMLISVFVLAGAASVAFDWFPRHMWQAWAGFLASFFISTVLSFGIMMIESRIESGKYRKALTLYQNANREEGGRNDGD